MSQAVWPRYSGSGCGHGPFEGDVVEMRHLFERLEPLIDLRVIKRIDTLGAEFLDVERCHHRAVDHSTAERFVRYFFLCGEIAHKSAGECVARTCRVKNAFQRVSRRGKIAVFCEQRRAVFAAFYDYRLQAKVHYLSGGFIDARLVR